ncbi:MAG: potassium uptake protein Kup system [Nevskia sp.]|nr:potassium uptake protein Kup system [Nevskia sp.]
MNEDRRLPRLALAALGVVYGDIGTSPVYALRACFSPDSHLSPTPANLLGILSLIIWSLLVTVTLKYLTVVMNANNKGEGGIVALVALLNPWRAKPGSLRHLLMLIGLFGGALLFGDATITPAISVLSAIEGIKVATPALHRWIIPITLAILAALFMIQRRGTGSVGVIFGPVMVLWFVVLGVLGVRGIVEHPAILAALNPWHGLHFLMHGGFVGFAVLGAVFLSVTGAEALYADMGHFGVAPIRIAWYTLVLPGLVLNYLGQGALILSTPEAVDAPFYHLVPTSLIYPAVVLTALATVIASQAVISGCFSLVRQLVQLGQFPRMNIVQTSSEEQGQIYIPFVNWTLLIATLGLVLGFKSSDNLSAAYGIAVSATMVITTVLSLFVARRYNWRLPIVYALTSVFIFIDLGFYASKMLKIEGGGWYPLAIAASAFIVMITWSRGRSLLAKELFKDTEPLQEFADKLVANPPYRIPGTAVFFTFGTHAPPRLVWHLERHHVLQERLILLTVLTEDEPRVATTERLQIVSIAPSITRITVRYGFMQEPNIPVALRLCEKLGLDLDLEHVTYYLGHETVIPTSDVPGMAMWRESLYSFLARNAMRPTAFYQLPPEDVVELGFQVEI